MSLNNSLMLGTCSNYPNPKRDQTRLLGGPQSWPLAGRCPGLLCRAGPEWTPWAYLLMGLLWLYIGRTQGVIKSTVAMFTWSHLTYLKPTLKISESNWLSLDIPRAKSPARAKKKKAKQNIHAKPRRWTLEQEQLRQALSGHPLAFKHGDINQRPSCPH